MGTNIVDAVTSSVSAAAIVPAVQPQDSVETTVATLVVATVSFLLNRLFDWWRGRKSKKGSCCE